MSDPKVTQNDDGTTTTVYRDNDPTNPSTVTEHDLGGGNKFTEYDYDDDDTEAEAGRSDEAPDDSAPEPASEPLSEYDDDNAEDDNS